VQLGVTEPAKSKGKENRWNNLQVWGEEDWLAWEDENFWKAMEVEDFEYHDCDKAFDKPQRNDKARKQAEVRVQKAWILRVGRSFVVGKNV